MKKFYTLSCLLAFAFIFMFPLQAQWQRTNGPYGNTVRCFGKNSAGLYAGSVIGGIFLSTDNGNSWIRKSTGLPADVYPLCMVTHNDTLYLATFSYGLYASCDNGDHWQSMNANIPSLLINGLAIKGDRFFLNAGRKMYVSDNGGLNWSAAGTEISDIYLWRLIADGDNVFAATQNGMYISENNGDSWELRNNGGLDGHDVLCLQRMGNKIYAGTNNGIFSSDDDGLNWINVSYNLSYDQKLINSLATYGGKLYAATMAGIFSLEDGSAEWQPAQTGLAWPGNIMDIAVSDTVLVSALEYFGVYSTSCDNINWVLSNHGLTSVYAKSVAAKGLNMYVTTNVGAAYSSDGGNSWQAANQGLPFLMLSAFAITGDKVYAGVYDFGIYYATVEDNSWTLPSNGIGIHTPRVIIANDAEAWCGTLDGLVFYSQDGGNNWEERSSGLANYAVNALVVKNDTVYAGTGNGIYRSVNKGSDYTLYGLSSKTVTSLLLMNDTLVAGTNGFGIFLIRSDLPDWNSISAGLTNTQVTSLLQYGDTLFAGTGGGVFVSGDKGNTWEESNIGLDDRNVLTLAKDYCAIYAGTSTGVFKQGMPSENKPRVTLSGDHFHCEAEGNIQWYNENGLVEGAIGADYQPAEEGNYYAIATIPGCCTAQSNVMEYISSGLPSNVNIETARVYPDPVVNELNVEIPGNPNRIKAEIIDYTGQIISQTRIAEKAVLSTCDLKPGLYMLRLTDEHGNMTTHKFLKTSL